MRRSSSAHLPRPAGEVHAWPTIRTLFPYLWQYKWRVSAALIALVSAKLASVAVPLVFKQMIDSLSPQETALALPVLLLIALTTVIVYHGSLPPLKKMVFSALLLYPNIWDNWLAPAWSLTMEIYFYLWIALIALLPQRYQIKVILCVMAVLTAWGIGWLIADRPSVFNGQQPLRYGLTGLGLEFLAGALLAHAYERKASLFKTPQATVPLCILLMAGGIVLLDLTALFFFLADIYAAGTKPRFILFYNIGILILTLAVLCSPAATPEAFALLAVPSAILIPVFFVRIHRGIALPVYLIFLAAAFAGIFLQYYI